MPLPFFTSVLLCPQTSDDGSAVESAFGLERSGFQPAAGNVAARVIEWAYQPLGSGVGPSGRCSYSCEVKAVGAVTACVRGDSTSVGCSPAASSIKVQRQLLSLRGVPLRSELRSISLTA